MLGRQSSPKLSSYWQSFVAAALEAEQKLDASAHELGSRLHFDASPMSGIARLLKELPDIAAHGSGDAAAGIATAFAELQSHLSGHGKSNSNCMWIES